MLRPTALFAASVLIAASAFAEPAPTRTTPLAPTDTRWVPLDVGNQWSYVFVRERSRSTNRAEPVLERFRGARTAEVRPAEPTWGARTLELRSIVKGRTEGMPTDSVERQREIVTSDGRGLRVLAREAVPAMGGNRELVEFDPPLESIRGGTPEGQTWSVGTEQFGGVRTVTEGQILGIQDARTPAGVFEKCLVVKRTGNARGHLDVYGSEIEVRSGTVTTTEWYAPGVGLVMAKSETQQTLALEDGSIIDFVEQTQVALREVELARTSAPAASTPAAPAPPSTEPELNPQVPIPSLADKAGIPGSAATRATPQPAPPPTPTPTPKADDDATAAVPGPDKRPEAPSSAPSADPASSEPADANTTGAAPVADPQPSGSAPKP